LAFFWNFMVFGVGIIWKFGGFGVLLLGIIFLFGYFVFCVFVFLSICYGWCF